MSSTNNPKPKPNRRGAKTATSTKPPTKKDQLIRLLSAKAGRDITSISEALGWQTHSTRAAQSGLRKSGYELVSEKAPKGGPARYRITGSPSEASLPVSEVPTDAG